jgi:hypothetical protein
MGIAMAFRNNLGYKKRNPAEMKVRQDILNTEHAPLVGRMVGFLSGWCRLDTMPFAWLAVADSWQTKLERFKLLLFLKYK